MLRIIAACFLLVFIQPIFAVAKLSGSAQQLVDLLQKTKTYQARFTQLTLDQNNNEIQKSAGIMQFERPGMFRWETFSPSHQIVVANSKWLWVYDVDLQQATKKAVEKSGLSVSHILSGDAAKILPQFKVTSLKYQNDMKFLLQPVNLQSAPFKNLSVTFNGDMLSRISIVNNLNQQNQFIFSDIKSNIKLSPSLFNFTAPKGVAVLNS